LESLNHLTGLPPTNRRIVRAGAAQRRYPAELTRPEACSDSGIADTQTVLNPYSGEPGGEHSVIYSRSQRAASGCRLSARPTKARERNLAFSTLLACFGGSQYGAIHKLAVTRPARGDASRRSNAAGSEVRAAAARLQSASLYKSDLGRRPSLKPPSRATRRRPRERTQATGRLLEHPAEFAHRLHPIRSIEPEPVEDRSQLGLARHLFSRISRLVQSSSMTYFWVSIGRNP
jgi:hypothetical protein